MKKTYRNQPVSFKTDKETLAWIKKIAENESQTISNVVHLAMRKARKNFRPTEITREAS